MDTSVSQMNRENSFLISYSLCSHSKSKWHSISAINDPHGQTHSPASSAHYSRLKVVLFCEILKTGRTDTTCENSDHYRP